MTPKEIRNELLAQKMIKNLKRRNFEAFYCPTAAEAVEKVSSLIPDGSSVTWGGSMTIRDMGLTAALHKRDLDILDRDLAADRDEAQRIYREAFSADYYLSSVNAISEDGVIVNIDGNGRPEQGDTRRGERPGARPLDGKSYQCRPFRHQDTMPRGRNMPQLQLSREHLQLHTLHAQLASCRTPHRRTRRRRPGILKQLHLFIKIFFLNS